MSGVNDWRVIVSVGAGGFLGALARYAWVSLWPQRVGFPWGIFSVNLAGCFLMGFLLSWWENRGGSAVAKQMWVTGFLGSLTTFSTFGWQVLDLLRSGRFTTGALYVLASVLLGVGAVALGWFLGQGWGTASGQTPAPH
ncbi:MAG: fluoride efflux transporter CrcB [Verrucomicrobiota bacterium]